MAGRTPDMAAGAGCRMFTRSAYGSFVCVGLGEVDYRSGREEDRGMTTRSMERGKISREIMMRGYIDAHMDLGATFKISELNTFLAERGYLPTTGDEVERLIPSHRERLAQAQAEANLATKQ
jgi:hypothetical protein